MKPTLSILALAAVAALSICLSGTTSAQIRDLPKIEGPPPTGNYYSAQKLADAAKLPPLPAPPGKTDVYQLDEGTFVYDDLDWDYTAMRAAAAEAASLHTETFLGDSTTGSGVGARLSYSVSNGTIIITWTSRGRLERTNQVPASDPWTYVTNAPPYTTPFTGNAKFFRLNQTVDATTLHKKVLVGYQGWFQASNQWDHWNRDWFTSPRTNHLTNITFEMWPDLTDYSNKYPVDGFTDTNGAQAYLFSSRDTNTIDLHFDWMQQYGIDGVVVQRFVLSTPPDNIQAWRTNQLKQAKVAANRTGRTFMLGYDMAGATNDMTLFTRMRDDWIYLVDVLQLTQDPRYLYHDGKPALIIYGFYPELFTSTEVPRQIIAWFKTNANYSVTLIGCGAWDWRSATGDWANVYRSFHGYIPWNTGNTVTSGTDKYAKTDYWAQDIVAATNAGMFYMPQVYPGFSWHNLKSQENPPPPLNEVPRRGGNFLWEQFHTVANLGVDMCFVGMFDEVDEGTAIFKVTNGTSTNSPPTQGTWVTYEGLPTDWYLRLTAEGSKVISGERPNTATIPIAP